MSARSMIPKAEHSPIFLFSFHRATNRQELLHNADKGTDFTDALVMPGVGAELDLTLISFDGETFSYAGLFTSANRAVTGKRRGKFELLHKLPKPLSIEMALRLTRLTAREIDATERISSASVTENAARELCQWILETTPSNSEVLDKIGQLRARMLAKRSDPFYLTLSEQRDAVGLLCGITDIDRAEILGLATQQGRESVRSFIDTLPGSSVKIDEKQILENDMAMFGCWTPNDPDFKGTRVYANGKSKITLICVDKSHIETSTGVDLIYHLDTFNSFVMIQYKRMKSNVYHPEKRCYRQLERMIETYSRLHAENSIFRSEADFRLSDNPFYFKVCEGETPIEYNESFVEGMYFPMEHWQYMLQDPQTRGPRDGVAVSRKTAPRWLSNTEFIDIAKNGWIGSTRAAGEKWAQELVQQSLNDARSVILARLMKVEIPPTKPAKASRRRAVGRQ